MKLGNKFLIYLFCGLLTFSVVSSSYYKTVHAFEYVGGALAFEEALKWLLACFGITATAGMTDAYWDTYGDDFVDYATQNGATQQEVAEWQFKLCEGILDKGSQVWTKFKNWVSSSIANQNSYEVPQVGANSDVVLNYINSYFGININSNGLSVVPVYAFQINFNSANFNDLWYCRLYTDNATYYINSSAYMTLNNNINYAVHYESKYRSENWKSDYGSRGINTTPNYQYCYYSDNIINNYPDSVSGTVPFGESSTGNTDFDTLDGVNTNDLDVISSDGVDEADDEVALPYPGVSDSDNTISNDAYQDIVDKINDGTITQEQGIEKIQELLRVITYDTVTDEVVPPQKNDDGTNKTKDDALKENKENAGFTLAGLENVFPFCIPFDIYAFMTLLVAEPETPEFDFPIKTVNGQQETIHVDLSPFEPVAVVVRYVFDFLFIVGLAMLTRSLIGGGSSD